MQNASNRAPRLSSPPLPVGRPQTPPPHTCVCVLVCGRRRHVSHLCRTTNPRTPEIEFSHFGVLCFVRVVRHGTRLRAEQNATENQKKSTTTTEPGENFSAQLLSRAERRLRARANAFALAFSLSAADGLCSRAAVLYNIHVSFNRCGARAQYGPASCHRAAQGPKEIRAAGPGATSRPPPRSHRAGAFNVCVCACVFCSVRGYTL